MKWADKKAAIIVALKDNGYSDEKQKDVLQKEDPKNPMIPTVNMKIQPKQGLNIPVYFINTEDLEGEYLQDVNGQLGAAKQIIRQAINSMETEPTGKPDIKPIKQTPIVKTPNPPTSIQLTGPVPLTVSVVQQYINPDATPEQAFNFIQLCEAHKLNPFIGEAHLIIYKGNAKMVVGVGGLMRRAQEEPDYNGYEAGILIEKDGIIEEREGTFMLKYENLVGGWCKVYSKEIDRPFVTKVSLDEYTQRKADGTPNKVWGSTGMPATMICKVAKSQGHRDACMGRNSGLYEQVEMMKDLGDVEMIE